MSERIMQNNFLTIVKLLCCCCCLSSCGIVVFFLNKNLAQETTSTRRRFSFDFSRLLLFTNIDARQTEKVSRTTKFAAARDRGKKQSSAREPSNYLHFVLIP
uniref:(northern house mosquito) hypothetical protein n=1 Tax=Culex pipiens TaxID=7175 RepID=A0A8D8AYT4_CULPI